MPPKVALQSSSRVICKGTLASGEDFSGEPGTIKATTLVGKSKCFAVVLDKYPNEVVLCRPSDLKPSGNVSNVQFKRSRAPSERVDVDGSSGDDAEDDSDHSDEGNETDGSERERAEE